MLLPPTKKGWIFSSNSGGLVSFYFLLLRIPAVPVPWYTSSSLIPRSCTKALPLDFLSILLCCALTAAAAPLWLFAFACYFGFLAH